MKDEYNEMEERVQPRFCIEKNYIIIECGEMTGFADLKSNVIIPVKAYEWILFGDDFIFIKEYDEDWRVFEITEKTIEEIEYEDIRYEENEFVGFKLYGKWEFEDLTEEIDDDEY